MGSKNPEEVDFNCFEEVYYMYETPETGLFQSTVMIEGMEFASIESLKREIKEQYGILVFEEDDEYEDGDDHYYDEGKVWTGEQITELVGRGDLEDILICKEGAYHWDDFNCEYEFAGTFNEKNIHRVKRLEIPEDKAMLIGDKITVIKSRTYDIVHEEVQIVNSEIRIELFTIKLLSGELITMPNNQGVFKVYEADIALIDHVD